MGDYTKVIVNCGIKKITGDQIEKFKEALLKEAPLSTSAYHCGGELLEVDNEWHHRTDLTFITQMKYSRGLEEFIDWLRPYVIDGVGEGDVFAMSFTEYQTYPTLYRIEEENETVP